MVRHDGRRWAGRLPVAAGVLAAGALSATIAGGGARAAEVVAFGDSWAHGAADELRAVFLEEGMTTVDVANAGVPGSTADMWANDLPSAFAEAVSANPDASWVWLSIGGNDLFAHHIAGQGAATAADLEVDLRAMLDGLYAVHPEIRVVLFGYDFPNFEQSVSCIESALFALPGMLTPDINQAFLDEVGAVQAKVAEDYPLVTYVPSVWGTLQAKGGVPGAPNVLFPSPSKFMADCIHANSSGYKHVLGALFDGYWGKPKPVAAFSPAKAHFCAGDTATFTDESAGAVSIAWSLDGAPAGSGETLQVETAAPGVLHVALHAEGGAWFDDAAALFEVHDWPLPDLPDEELWVCAGASLVLDPGPVPADSWTWTPASGLDDPTKKAPKATPAADTTWTVTATNGPGCQVSDTVTVLVEALPEVDLDGPTKVESGEKSTYSATLEGATGLVWEVDGDATHQIGLGGLTVTWGPAGKGKVSVTGLTPHGCTASDSLAVTIAPASPGEPEGIADPEAPPPGEPEPEPVPLPEPTPPAEPEAVLEPSPGPSVPAEPDAPAPAEGADPAAPGASETPADGAGLAKDGGGCDASGGVPPAGTSLLVAGLLAALVRGRRRQRVEAASV